MKTVPRGCRNVGEHSTLDKKAFTHRREGLA